MTTTPVRPANRVALTAGDVAVTVNQFHRSQPTSEWHRNSAKEVSLCAKTHRGEVQSVETVCGFKKKKKAPDIKIGYDDG